MVKSIEAEVAQTVEHTDEANISQPLHRVAAGLAGVSSLLLLAGCGETEGAAALPEKTATPTHGPNGLDNAQPPTPDSTAPEQPLTPTATATATPEMTEQQAARFDAIREIIEVLDQDLQHTTEPGTARHLWIDKHVYGTGRVSLMYSATTKNESDQSVAAVSPPQLIGIIDLNEHTLIHQTFGTVPVAALQVTSDGLTVLSPPASGEPAVARPTFVLDDETLRWKELVPEATPTPEATSAPEAAPFFETAPFTLDEITELLGLGEYTQVMTGTTPTGATMSFYVGGMNEHVPSQHQVSRIDFINPETGQPDNDVVAGWNQQAALEMQRKANAIGRDGRAAPSTAPEPGQERLTVVNLAALRPGSEVGADAKGNLMPALETVTLPANDPSIEHYIHIVNFVAPGDHQAGGSLGLPDGTRVNLHMHGGATGQVSYTGTFLAEMANGGRVLITVGSTWWHDLLNDPILFMGALTHSAGSIQFSSLPAAYIKTHYGVAGPGAPIVTKDIRDIRPSSEMRELRNTKITPNLRGQP